MTSTRTGIGLAFSAAMISGVSVWLNGMAVRAFGDPTLYTTAKNLVAAALLLSATLILTGRGSKNGFTRPRSLGQLIGLGAIGVFGGGVAFVLFFEGLARTSATSAGFIQKTLVIWVAIFAVNILRERFGRAHVAAIALLLSGQFVLSGGIAMPALNSGEAMIFAATLLWAVEVVLAKRLLAGLTPATVACARMGIGSVVLIGISIASGAVTALGSLGPSQWAWVALTGVILTAYVTVWFAALARAKAIDVTAILVFGAIITGALSSGGVFTPSGALVGLVLIALGTAVVGSAAWRSGSMVSPSLRSDRLVGKIQM